ncbi:ATP-binding protein [Sporomusa aerivorans]|uniref:ATP-binding protein n=1 Tax=Sporomusa aerivorans TaxID=204936 RepID=UPI00352A653B
MSLLQEFCSVFAVPGFIIPYLHFFVTAEEMQLVIILSKEPSHTEAIAARMGKEAAETAALLAGAYQRCIIDKENNAGTDYYIAGSFYNRLKKFCQFGNYHVLPRRIRKELDAWDFDEYVKRNNYFRQVLAHDPEYENCHNEWILLLAEAEAMIDAASAIRVLPCDCKMLADNCDHSREICLVLDEKRLSDRTGGRELSKEEAKQLIRRLDQEGLMHTGGPANWRESGPQVVCNCCTCCCYPFRAGQKFGTKGRWPKSRYLAVYHAERCVQCGLCVRRCGFEAFIFAEEQGEKVASITNQVAFIRERCWGCGLCANACPAHAIELIPVEQA